MKQLGSPKSRFNLKRIIVGVFVVLIVVVAWFVAKYMLESRQISAAGKTSTSFVTNLIDGNTQAAYQLTSPYFRQYTDESKLNDYAKALDPYVSSVPEPDLNVSDQLGPFRKLQYASIVYPLNGPNGKGEIKVVLEKSNRKWLVRAFSVDIK